MEETRAHLAPRARRRLQVVIGALLAVAGTAALAAPVMQHARSPEVARRIADLAPAPAPSHTVEQLVWEGADVDGDGQPDFANPTGQELRTTDAYGCGDFGARRDGGTRKHEGADFKADAGQRVVAPISGYVSKIGFAYPGDTALKFVEITNPALHYQARVFYIDPAVELGQTVRIGQTLGAHHTLERKYPGGMTDHVHLEVIDTAGRRIDPTHVITARYEPVETPGQG
jgi:murein DD-endopeptidase MepM/ murein hydrolase activator NlpD